MARIFETRVSDYPNADGFRLGSMNAPQLLRVSYACPNDVPVPMRHTIRTCHGNGFSVKDLALIYELPEQWVQLFVMPD